jgi:hypothetical protein
MLPQDISPSNPVRQGEDDVWETMGRQLKGVLAHLPPLKKLYQ